MGTGGNDLLAEEILFSNNKGFSGGMRLTGETKQMSKEGHGLSGLD